MSTLLIMIRQIKTHYSKVIGNETIKRQVIELGGEGEREAGLWTEAVLAVPAIFVGYHQGYGWLCGEDILQSHHNQAGQAHA